MKGTSRGYMTQRSPKSAPDSWSLVLHVGYAANGKRIQKWLTFKGTERAAQKELTRLLRELDTGTYIDPSKQTVAEYLRAWLVNSARISARTREGYSEICEKHLIPQLGRLQLGKLSPQHIQTYYTTARTSGRRDGKGGLSEQSILHHHRLLHKALSVAVAQGTLARNPVDSTEAPQPARREMQAADADQTAELLASLEGTPIYLPVLVAVTTGVRRGELLALKWESLDLKSGMLTVRAALEQTRAGITTKGTKTGRVRKLSVPSFVLDELRRHKGQQAAHRLQLGDCWQDLGLVFCREDGTQLNPRNFSKSFYDHMRRRGKTLRLHDLRHSHASQLLSQGVNLRVVADRLGHADPGLTLRVYSHVLAGQDEAAAEKIDDALTAAIGARKRSV